MTPLMAKLSLLAQEENLFEAQTPSVARTPGPGKPPFTVPKTPINPPDENVGTEKIEKPGGEPRKSSSEAEEELIPVVLYVFGHKNAAVLLLLESEVAVDPDCIHSLVRSFYL